MEGRLPSYRVLYPWKSIPYHISILSIFGKWYDTRSRYLATRRGIIADSLKCLMEGNAGPNPRRKYFRFASSVRTIGIQGRKDGTGLEDSLSSPSS